MKKYSRNQHFCLFIVFLNICLNWNERKYSSFGHWFIMFRWQKSSIVIFFCICSVEIFKKEIQSRCLRRILIANLSGILSFTWRDRSQITSAIFIFIIAIVGIYYYCSRLNQNSFFFDYIFSKLVLMIIRSVIFLFL